MIGEGKNRIPTIHVRDLVKFVEKIIEKPPSRDNNYIFAVDHTSKPTQLSIVQAISTGVGNGKIKHVDIATAALECQNFDVFMLDVRLRPSRVFEGVAGATSNDQDDGDDDTNEEDPAAAAVSRMKAKFDWHTRNGLAASMAKVNREFNDFRGFKSNRIFLHGPPAAGKSFFGKK